MNTQETTCCTEGTLKDLRVGVLQVFDNGRENERDRFTVYYGSDYYQLPVNPFDSLAEPISGRGKAGGKRIPPSQLPEACRLWLRLKGLQLEGEHFFFWPGPHGRFIGGEGRHYTTRKNYGFTVKH